MRSWKAGLAVVVMFNAGPLLYAQSPEKKPPPITIPSPFKLEFSQRFNPSDTIGKTSVERFRLSADIHALTLNYSNQAPSVLTGRQLAGVPANYSLVELQVRRKWGTVSTFRSTGYNSRYIPAAAARRISGLGLELPKALLGTKITGYLLQASPEKSDPSLKRRESRKGSQAVLGAARDFKKGFKLRMELAQSSQPLPPGVRSSSHGYGYHLRLDGPIFKADTGLAFRTQNENLTSALAPARGRGRNLLTIDVRRKFGLHQLQYSGKMDALDALLLVRLPSARTNQETIRWSYAPKRLPQLVAAQTWTLQSGPGRREAEDSLLLSMNKSLSRLTLGFSYLHGSRTDEMNLRHLWERTSLAGDASIEFVKQRRLNLRYEIVDFNLMPSSSVMTSENIQLNTRLSCFGDRLTLSPAVDMRRQADRSSGLRSSLVNWVLTALMKLPRYFPGTDVLMTLSSRHLAALGSPNQRSTAFVIQWNFKRS